MSRTILQGIVGSTAYGLAREGSDIDRMSVFVASTLEIAGLDWHQSKDSQVKQGPEGDDFSAHEVGKFVRLALKANPTITELLWLEQYEILDNLGKSLVSVRRFFLSSSGVKSAYLGYANAQFQKFEKSGIKKRKHARHCLRLLRQGLELLETGAIEIQVKNPDEYFSLDDMTDDQVVEKLNKEFSSVEEKISSMDDSDFALPLIPDREKIAVILREIRKECLF